jgi:hypothetical protein
VHNINHKNRYHVGAASTSYRECRDRGAVT